MRNDSQKNAIKDLTITLINFNESSGINITDIVPHFNIFESIFNRSDPEISESDYELVFSESEGNTILEFKKLSDTEFSVDELVDVINESLSWLKAV